MAATRVLIIEDDHDAAEALELLVESHGYAARTAGTGAEGRELFENVDTQLVLMDMVLPDVAGLELLREFREMRPEAQIIVVTGFGTVPAAVDAMGAGAFSFIEKPVDPNVLLAMLGKAQEKMTIAAENQRLRDEVRDHTSFSSLVARSESMHRLFHMIGSVAVTDASVLITGESGTGKELIATAIHRNSRRTDGPFIKINCAAIPQELIESELFGHKRGAFTGAVADKTGLMELADGGSLLLDEVAEMPLHVQAKLLRVLQDREFRPVGGSRAIQPNFRLLSATNVNVEAALSQGKLREDLYFRINTVMLAIPALRDRPEDIPLLVEHFLHKFSSLHERDVRALNSEAAKTLMEYSWPGNVRELEHVIERAVIVAEGSEISRDDLMPLGREEERLPQSGGFAIPPHYTLAEIEKLAIVQTLERTHWNKRKAASILGVYRPTLYHKLKKYNLIGQADVRPRQQKKPAEK
jgi:DNA-binding NtrC family response regulator